MTMRTDSHIESMIFDYIDEFKFLFFPDQWSNIFMDYSKNEILAMLFIYRKGTVNMTEVAEYISAPLNTATGVITRLEKKMMAERKRSLEDKRVVEISLTPKGQECIEEEKKVLEYYFKEVYKTLSGEEKKIGISIITKVIGVLKASKQGHQQEEKVSQKVKRIIIE